MSYEKDLIVCVILNTKTSSILLKDFNYSTISSSNLCSYWFPFIHVNRAESTLETAKSLIKNLDLSCKLSTENCEIVRLLRITSTHLLPVNNEQMAKCTYFYCVTSNPNAANDKTEDFIDTISNDNSASTTTNHHRSHLYKWMNASQLRQAQRSSQLLGLEPIQIYKQIIESEKNSNNMRASLLFNEPKLSYIESNGTTNPSASEQLIASAHFTKAVQDKLCALFYMYSFPSDYLNLASFCNLFKHIFMLSSPAALLPLTASFESDKSDTEYDQEEYDFKFRNYFYAFDSNQKCLLTFTDFVMGLAAMEPITQHGGVPAEQRCRYIFRFYTYNNQQINQKDNENGSLNSMSFEQFKVLINDIHALKKNPPLEDAALDTEALNAFKLFGLSSPSEPLLLSDFLIGVGQLKFRGTSVLFRLSKSIIDLLSIIASTRATRTPATFKALSVHDDDYSFETISENDVLKIKNQVMPMKRMKQNEIVKNAKLIRNFNESTNIENFVLADDYELASHTVKVKRSGALVDIATLWDLEGATTPNGLDFKNSLFENCKPQFGRIQSVDFFNQKSQPNEMLNGLRYYERAIKETSSLNHSKTSLLKEAFSWGKVDMVSMARCLINICKHVQEVMINEDRLLVINAPCYILGDIHGNFHDLVSFEKTLWRMGPMLTPSSFLFLGDYVDRGSEGIEVISYLFAQKLLCPNKFFLLRGNHELRNIQQMFHFHSECLTKFGDMIGQQVWEEINNAFDCMPLAAVVDKKIFCIHGGIPSCLNGQPVYLQDINKIQCPLRDPENESPLAWEIMWNDPVSEDCEVNEQMLVKNNGFVHNSRRGTANFFSNDALKQFLDRNKLSYVVRAHEVQQVGFKVQLGGRLLTVFSSSYYCGGSNEAATVLVDSNKLRLIRLDTIS